MKHEELLFILNYQELAKSYPCRSTNIAKPKNMGARLSPIARSSSLEAAGAPGTLCRW
jgi:hypothetical protein